MRGWQWEPPTSAILVEIFVQYLEHNHIINILQNCHIIDYYRYVYDILIIQGGAEKRENLK
jgi:hypothetical protein